MTEDEMVGWHHQLNEHEFEQTPGVGDGQGGLACCDSWGSQGRITEVVCHLLMKVEEESEKAGLKLYIQKTKIMASCPITSRQTDGETMRDFIFLGSKITTDGDCSHEIK